jgi:hypothetical protein
MVPEEFPVTVPEPGPESDASRAGAPVTMRAMIRIAAARYPAYFTVLSMMRNPVIPAW